MTKEEFKKILQDIKDKIEQGLWAYRLGENGQLLPATDNAIPVEEFLNYWKDKKEFIKTFQNISNKGKAGAISTWNLETYLDSGGENIELARVYSQEMVGSQFSQDEMGLYFAHVKRTIKEGLDVEPPEEPSPEYSVGHLRGAIDNYAFIRPLYSDKEWGPNISPRVADDLKRQIDSKMTADEFKSFVLDNTDITEDNLAKNDHPIGRFLDPVISPDGSISAMRVTSYLKDQGFSDGEIMSFWSRASQLPFEGRDFVGNIPLNFSIEGIKRLFSAARSKGRGEKSAFYKSLTEDKQKTLVANNAVDWATDPANEDSWKDTNTVSLGRLDYFLNRTIEQKRKELEEQYEGDEERRKAINEQYNLAVESWKDWIGSVKEKINNLDLSKYIDTDKMSPNEAKMVLMSADVGIPFKWIDAAFNTDIGEVASDIEDEDTCTSLNLYWYEGACHNSPAEDSKGSPPNIEESARAIEVAQNAAKFSQGRRKSFIRNQARKARKVINIFNKKIKGEAIGKETLNALPHLNETLIITKDENFLSAVADIVKSHASALPLDQLPEGQKNLLSPSMISMTLKLLQQEGENIDDLATRYPRGVGYDGRWAHASAMISGWGREKSILSAYLQFRSNERNIMKEALTVEKEALKKELGEDTFQNIKQKLENDEPISGQARSILLEVWDRKMKEFKKDAMGDPKGTTIKRKLENDQRLTSGELLTLEKRLEFQGLLGDEKPLASKGSLNPQQAEQYEEIYDKMEEGRSLTDKEKEKIKQVFGDTRSTEQEIYQHVLSDKDIVAKRPKVAKGLTGIVGEGKTEEELESLVDVSVKTLKKDVADREKVLNTVMFISPSKIDDQEWRNKKLEDIRQEIGNAQAEYERIVSQKGEEKVLEEMTKQEIRNAIKEEGLAAVQSGAVAAKQGYSDRAREMMGGRI